MLFLDLDGTLLDARARYYATYVETLRAEDIGGLPIPEREFWFHRSEAKPWDELLKMSRLFPTKYEAFKDRFEERLEAPEMLLLDRVRSGSLTFLGKVYTKTPIVLVTLRRDGIALENQLAELKIRSYFAEVLFGAPKRPRRPNKDLRWRHKAGLIRARYKMPPTDALLIGDTETDVGVARSFAWEVFLVEGGHRSKRRQIKAEPDRIVADLSASLKHLLPGGRWQR
ncbi:MAG: HAD family hydrolase [Deltaproteobacteria bacterium]|nr:HAD family hydrolase [Deltaproteobacteria bacterium]